MGTDVFDELSIADNKLLIGLDNANEDHKKILDIFARRVTLYKECADKEDDPIIKAIIDAKKSVIMSDMGLLSTQYAIQSDIAKITSRIDVLEEKISRIQDRESSL
jgi:polyhydroxyalkanoate synthesis regulator phasin